MFTLAVIGFVGGLIPGISPCILPVLAVIFFSGARSVADEGPARAHLCIRHRSRPAVAASQQAGERHVPECREICKRSSPSDPEAMAVASTEVAHVTGVDTADVPSARWGWSAIKHRTWHITGLIIFVFLLAMLRGNHVGHIENWFLIGFAALVLFVLVRDLWGRRRGWIR